MVMFWSAVPPPFDTVSEIVTGPAVCGACHGVPPADAAHAGNPGLTDCAGCHPQTMDATGALLPGGKHLDGVIDAQ